MVRKFIPFAAAVLLAAGAQTVAAQQTISSRQARAIAVKQVADGQGVTSEKLKTKDGILVYEFDIETAGAGHQEVRVDARSGAVIYSRHEDDVAGKVWSGLGKAADKTEEKVKDAAHAVSREADRVFSDLEADKIDPPISRARATKIAEGSVKGAPVKDVDLETENGVLVWEVDLDTAGSGHEEVLVDAYTGAVLRVSHED
jgi:uncharacterized membrane protein YkoI